VSDWGLISIDAQRAPKEDVFYGLPPEGQLSDTVWKDVQGFGPLMWDQLVRKNGRKTGLTFGFVAGVHAGWKPLQHGMNKSCSEYYVLDDHSMFSNMFADKGDSGAAVITDGGLVVGFVFAGIAITSVQIITLPGTRDTPDIKTTAVRREDDGSLDLND
jgi:hypothetical protein